MRMSVSCRVPDSQARFLPVDVASDVLAAAPLAGTDAETVLATCLSLLPLLAGNRQRHTAFVATVELVSAACRALPAALPEVYVLNWAHIRCGGA